MTDIEQELEKVKLQMIDKCNSTQFQYKQKLYLTSYEQVREAFKESIQIWKSAEE